MRPLHLLTLLVAAALLTVPLALADGPSDRSRGRAAGPDAHAAAAAHEAGDAEPAENETEEGDAGAARGRDAARVSERAAERASFREDRAAFMESFVAQLRGFRASWHENATAIREACHAAQPSENATEDERKDAAHCIRDGYAEWRATQRAEIKDLRAQLRELVSGWSSGRGHAA